MHFHNRTTLLGVPHSTLGYRAPMSRLQTVAHGVAIVGAVLAVLGWVVGGFPAPDGDAQSLLLAGIALGLVAEVGVWAATRRD